MRESNIVHEAGKFWVYKHKDRYSVREDVNCVSVEDSAFALNADGLSLAICRCEGLAIRAEGRLPTAEERKQMIKTAMSKAGL